MKFYLLFSLSILFYLEIYAQQGKVIYDQTQKLTIKVDGMNEELKNILPSMSEKTKELTFNKTTSLYQDVTEAKTHEFSSSDIGNEIKIQVKTRAAQEQTYFNHETESRIDQREIMGKLFLIEDSASKPKWKILNEQKEILGYTCMKAGIQKNDSTYIEAWFAPQIQVFAGPEEYFGLPGLILEINENEGEKMIVAKEIDLDANLEIERPKKGDKVSWEEFDEIQAKKMEEMKEMYNLKGKNGKQGVFIIRQG